MSVLVLLAMMAAAPAAEAGVGPKGASEKAPKDALSAADANLQPSVVFGRAAPSVMVVLAPVKGGTSLGSGVVVAKELVVTNAHVIEGADEISVKQGNRSWSAKIQAIDGDHDLALLRVAELDRPAVVMRDSSLLTVGERAFAIGAPQGLELSLTDGLVSSVRREGTPTGVQTSAPISKGSSGGGLFDGQGRLIGVTTFYLRNGQNLNFAVPAEHVTALLDGKRVPDAVLAAPSAEPPQWTVTARPEALRCDVSSYSMWGDFSDGLILVESQPVTARWWFRSFNSQTPKTTFLDVQGDGIASNLDPDVVLTDLSKKSAYVEFQGQRKRGLLVFFMDGDAISVTKFERATLAGQPRIVGLSGPCTAMANSGIEYDQSFETQANKKVRRPVSASKDPESLCKAGNADHCLAVAEAKPRDEALEFFIAACSATDGSRAAAAKGCQVVSDTFRSVGDVASARRYRKRACTLEPSGCR
jgi:hypothetical protein